MNTKTHQKCRHIVEVESKEMISKDLFVYWVYWLLWTHQMCRHIVEVESNERISTVSPLIPSPPIWPTNWPSTTCGQGLKLNLQLKWLSNWDQFHWELSLQVLITCLTSLLVRTPSSIFTSASPLCSQLNFLAPTSFSSNSTIISDFASSFFPTTIGNWICISSWRSTIVEMNFSCLILQKVVVRYPYQLEFTSNVTLSCNVWPSESLIIG